MITSRPRAFRVAVLGQNGVGKTALTVRFMTRRYIGEYDPHLERVYSCQRNVNGTTVEFEVWDTAGLNENSKVKEHIRWADAIILMYDVTDQCSFEECSRLKFLVNALSRRSRRKTGSDPNSEFSTNIPVALVGNKKDRDNDRMVLPEEGATRSGHLNCVSFHEVSAQEDIEDILDVFDELYVTHRKLRKFRMSLSNSKSSLFGEKAGSSSEEDNDEGDGDGGGGGGGSRRGTLTSPMTSPMTSPIEELSQEELTRKGRSRKGTLSSSADEDISQDEMIRRARSRRREAFYTMS